MSSGKKKVCQMPSRVRGRLKMVVNKHSLRNMEKLKVFTTAGENKQSSNRLVESPPS